MIEGKPKREIQWLMNARATVSAEMSEMGTASGHRVKRSIQSLTGRMVRTPASRALGREFYPGLCSYSVFAIICGKFAMQACGKLPASSSYGDFETCVNLLQACFTLVVTNLQKACRFAVQVCCKFAAN
ncbi:hypothetical protein AVEN_58626-1 [Araneus ventricosus]|uniref:Uncharacterized protein n=1 Tax=Araneus ventricosus TaxID=182803 RepID=A0A4Y2PM13_ARAVE|nr:hypothetical protein AVEN_58626-1 [Araneus ventricosus]